MTNDLVKNLIEAISESEYDELLEQYGNEFLIENNRGDDELYSMDSLNDMFESCEPSYILARSFHGHRYCRYNGSEKECFNPNDDYFYINAYGNWVSVNEYDVASYFDYCIDKEEFVEWLIDEGNISPEDYIEGYEEEDED